MINATRITASTFGAIAAVVGVEHGIGEILQGSIAPDGLVILSWPRSPFFEILAGEPAMTIIPNLLITGVFAIFFSLIFLIWVTVFVERKNSRTVLILLSVIMLLVGAGFGPPLLGVIIALTAGKINAPLIWWRTHLSAETRRFLGNLWAWFFAITIIAWLFLFPGTSILSYFLAVNSLILVPIIFLVAFGFLWATIFTALAHDSLK